MALPLIVWGTIAAAGTFGGMVFWGRERAKLKSGDTAFVPSSSISIANPLSIPIKVDAIAGLGGLVQVDKVLRADKSATATGTAGKEVGVSVSVSFPVSSVDSIERDGHRFDNPERK